MTGRNRIGEWADAEPEDEMLAPLFRTASGDPGRRPSCPDSDLVQAAATGTLPADVERVVAAHVQHCAVCQALREALDDPSVGRLTADEQQRILERVRTHASAEEQPRIHNRSWWRISTAAAAVAVVITLSAVARQFGSAPAQAPRHAPPFEGSGSSVFRLEKPAAPVPGGTGLVWRGTNVPQSAVEFEQALDAYRADDFSEAAQRLKGLVRREPQNAAARFYLGVSELFAGDNAAAAATLEAAATLAGEEAGGREATWYLALAYRRTGQRDRAAASLNALCASKGPHAADACAGLRELAGAPAAPP
jgi:TolA-binding protein